jgi:hypothetical protein
MGGGGVGGDTMSVRTQGRTWAPHAATTITTSTTTYTGHWQRQRRVCDVRTCGCACACGRPSACATHHAPRNHPNKNGRRDGPLPCLCQHEVTPAAADTAVRLATSRGDAHTRTHASTHARRRWVCSLRTSSWACVLCVWPTCFDGKTLDMP